MQKSYSLSKVLDIIKLKEEALIELANSKVATFFGFMFMILYGIALYIGFLAIPHDVYKLLPIPLSPEQVPELIVGKILFAFVMLLIIHFVASLYSQTQSFWPFFRVVSQSFILGTFSVLLFLDILMLWRYVVIYKALKLLYGLADFTRWKVLLYSFAIFTVLNLVAQILVGK